MSGQVILLPAMKLGLVRSSNTLVPMLQYVMVEEVMVGMNSSTCSAPDPLDTSEEKR